MSMIALGQIGHVEGLKSVPPMLADKEPGVRRIAVQVLDKFLNPGATRALVDALADSDEAVRADAARAVASRIQGNPKETLRLLADTVAKSKGAGRLAAIQCLAADSQKARSAQDAKRLRVYDGLLDGPKAPLAAALIAALADEEPKARAAAGKFLNKHGWDHKIRGLVEPVAALANDLDPDARQTGIAARNYLNMMR
jgi:HEAT repeat protein